MFTIRLSAKTDSCHWEGTGEIQTVGHLPFSVWGAYIILCGNTPTSCDRFKFNIGHLIRVNASSALSTLDASYPARQRLNFTSLASRSDSEANVWNCVQGSVH